MIIRLKPKESQQTGAVRLPVTLPINFSGEEIPEGMIKLPITLPMSFSQGSVPAGMVRLPITLPMKFSSGSSANRKKVRLTTSVTPNEGQYKSSTKLPLQETASLTVARLPIRETAWNFKGIILEENVVGRMSAPLTLIEEVRSRILVDTEILNRNTIKVKWYGDKVPKVEVTKKMAVDDEYESVGLYDWEAGEAIFEVDNNEYNIKLVGTNNTGESSVVEIGEGANIDINTILNVSLNEKIYNVNVDNTSYYKIYVNY